MTEFGVLLSHKVLATSQTKIRRSSPPFLTEMLNKNAGCNKITYVSNTISKRLDEKGTKLNQLLQWLVRNQILLLEQLLLHLAFPLLAYLPCRAFLLLLHSGTAW